jgi:acetoacetate decarboxylase
MKEAEVRRRAFAKPLTSPAYPIGPYRFYNREFLVITYRTDPQKLRDLVPEPLAVKDPLVKFEFIRMPDSTGFGDYTESGQVIPVSFQGRAGGYSHCMFLDDHPPLRAGASSGAFRRSLPSPPCGPRSIRSWERWTTDPFELPPAPWATSTRLPTMRP